MLISNYGCLINCCMHAYILDELMKSSSNHRDELDHIPIWSPVPCLQIQTLLFPWKETLHIKINVLMLYCIMKKTPTMNIIHSCIMYMYLQKLPSICFNIIIQGKLKLIHTCILKILV